MSATPDLRFEPDRERDSVAYALGVLRRRWLVVVAAIVVCVAVGVVISGLNSDKRYESSARVLFGTSSLSNAVLQVPTGTDDPEREAARRHERDRAPCADDRATERRQRRHAITRARARAPAARRARRPGCVPRPRAPARG